MARPMIPLALSALQERVKSHLLLVLVVGGIVAVVGYYWWTPTPPPLAARQAQTKGRVIPGIGEEQTNMEKAFNTLQQTVAQEHLTTEELRKTVATLANTFATTERDRKTEAQAAQTRLEEAVKQAQEAGRRAAASAQQTRQPSSGTRTTTKKPAAETAALPVATTPPLPKIEMRLLKDNEDPSYRHAPVAANRQDLAYLPMGSYAEARTMTGVVAVDRNGGGLPIQFAATQMFYGPFQLHGPGQESTPTAIPIQGCLFQGEAEANLATKRIGAKLTKMACVLPDKSTFESSILAYVVGIDGKFGLPGTLETHDGAYLGRAILASIMQGGAAAFQMGTQTSITTPLGGVIIPPVQRLGQTAAAGAANLAAARAADFYFSQAERFLPSLSAPAGEPARIILQEGVALPGLPTALVLTREN